MDGSERTRSAGFLIADAALLALLTLAAAVAAVLGFFHLAWYVGVVPMPVSALVLAAVVWLLSGLAHRLVRATWAAILPWAGCLVVTVVLVTASNAPLSKLPLRVLTVDLTAGTLEDGNWRLLLLAGALLLAAAVQLSLIWAGGVSARVAGNAPADDAPAPPTPTVTGATSAPTDDRPPRGGVDTGS